jgi:hypothetical protein
MMILSFFVKEEERKGGTMYKKCIFERDDAQIPYFLSFSF